MTMIELNLLSLYRDGPDFWIQICGIETEGWAGSLIYLDRFGGRWHWDFLWTDLLIQRWIEAGREE